MQTFMRWVNLPMCNDCYAKDLRPTGFHSYWACTCKKWCRINKIRCGMCGCNYDKDSKCERDHKVADVLIPELQRNVIENIEYFWDANKDKMNKISFVDFKSDLKSLKTTRVIKLTEDENEVVSCELTSNSGVNWLDIKRKLTDKELYDQSGQTKEQLN